LAQLRRVGVFAAADGAGVAVVETARGLLLHRAVLSGGRVADYRIVAPTEWNFHPAGPLVQGLEGEEAIDAALLERNARLAVEALDPCVACNVEIVHA
jgi:coenzyme F420-reducing hydrogenase alpha subunit